MEITIKTNTKNQVLDITDIINKFLLANGLKTGVSVVVVKHTTAAITTADLDPGTDLDLLDFLAAIVPKINWRHPHNPAHAPAHLLASIIGSALVVNVNNKSLELGTWQRIVLVELDGPRERNLSLRFLPA